MSNIYMDIIKAQQRQGNLGGKRETDSERKKREKAEKKEMQKSYTRSEKYETIEYELNLSSGEVFEATDANGFSDPYITVSIVREDGKSTKQIYRSSVQKKTLKPQWNEKGTLKIKSNIKTLIIQLWDQDLLSSNDFIGGNTINISSYGVNSHDLDMYEEKDSKQVLKGKVKFTYQKKSSLSAKVSSNMTM